MTANGRQLPIDFYNSNNYIKALFLTLNSNFINVKEKYYLAICHQIFIKNLNFKPIVAEKIKNLENRLYSLNQLYAKQLDDPLTASQISKMFTPSKIASNGLNFFTKEDENNLCKKEQTEEILDVFRIIYIILNENYSDLPNNKLIENLFNSVMPKLKVENLSKQYIYFRKFICFLHFKNY
jgi:hypothetical protein